MCEWFSFFLLTLSSIFLPWYGVLLSFYQQIIMMMEAITDSLAAVQCDGCVTAAAGSSVTAVTGNT